VNVCDIIESYQVIIDCTDNFSTRYLINDACVLMDKPLVYGAIHRMEGQVSVFNYQQGPTYRCLFNEAPESDAGTNCSEIGVLGALPGVIGTFQAIEAIKILVGIGEPLSGKLLLYDARSSSIQFVKLTRKEHPIYAQQTLDVHLYEQNCANENIDSEIFQRYEQIIDVRELHEVPRITLSQVKTIPLGELKNRLNEIDITQRTLIVCHSGKRSNDALQQIKERTNMIQLDHLAGGISSLIAESNLINE
jgi:adenylyltransferase/sulfurtransferase